MMDEFCIEITLCTQDDPERAVLAAMEYCSNIRTNQSFGGVKATVGAIL